MRNLKFFLLKIISALLMTVLIFTVFNMADKPYRLRMNNTSEGFEVAFPSENESEQIINENIQTEPENVQKINDVSALQPQEINIDIPFDSGEVSVVPPEFNPDISGVKMPAVQAAQQAQSSPSKKGNQGLSAYQLKDVDEKPRLVFSVKPVYPAYALKTRQEGKVYVTLRLGPDGKVVHAKVFKSSPKDIFDKAALEAVRQWRFSSAYKDRQKVSVWNVIVPISFTLTN